jgi:hypothetical protein
MTTPAARKLLKDAAWLITQPGCWTQGAASRDLNGGPHTTLDSHVCWCAYGALFALSQDDLSVARDASDLFDSFNDNGLVTINDRYGMTAAHMAQLMREAAEWEEGTSEAH